MTGSRFSGFAAPVQSGLLYGAEGSSKTTSDLYTIDPVTVALTSVGPIGFALTGMAFRPSDGVLFGATSQQSASDARSLITIDTSTGTGTLVGAFLIGGGSTLGDIAFTQDDSLYGYDTGSHTLWEVNTSTGLATQVSGTVAGGQGFGCSVDSSDNFYVFHTTSGVFYLVNVSTGGLTAQPNLNNSPISGSVGAASFDSADVCYASLLSALSVHLVTIDIATGTITDVGATPGGERIDAICWSVT